jgi:hypothetical protein
MAALVPGPMLWTSLGNLGFWCRPSTPVHSSDIRVAPLGIPLYSVHLSDSLVYPGGMSIQASLSHIMAISRLAANRWRLRPVQAGSQLHRRRERISNSNKPGVHQAPPQTWPAPLPRRDWDLSLRRRPPRDWCLRSGRPTPGELPPASQATITRNCFSVRFC